MYDPMINRPLPIDLPPHYTEPGFPHLPVQVFVRTVEGEILYGALNRQSGVFQPSARLELRSPRRLANITADDIAAVVAVPSDRHAPIAGLPEGGNEIWLVTAAQKRAMAA